MGKASSAKKVARAARSGGAKRSNRARPTFPLVIAAVVLAGVGTVVYAQKSHESLSNSEVHPVANTDHYHSAYGFYVCDKFIPGYKDIDGKADELGIHSHADQTGTAGDGIIHNHPFKSLAAGERARLNVWAPMVGLKFFDDGWQLPDGTEYRNGGATCGDKPAKVAIYRSKADTRQPVEVYDKNFGDILLNQDRDAITFAVLPEGAPVPPPKPDSVAGLDSLSDVTGAGGAGGATGLEGLEGIGGAEGGVQVPVEGGADPAAPVPAPAPAP